MTAYTKKLIPPALLIALLSGFTAFTYQWGAVNKALADHTAEASIHRSNDVLEERMQSLEERQGDFEEETRDNWSNQGVVNTEVLKGLSKIQGHLGIK